MPICTCSLVGPEDSVKLTKLQHRDTGLSRIFLWWVWNQDLPTLQHDLKSRVRPSLRASLETKVTSLFHSVCRLLRIHSDAGESQDSPQPCFPVLELACTSMSYANTLCWQPDFELLYLLPRHML